MNLIEKVKLLLLFNKAIKEGKTMDTKSFIASKTIAGILTMVLGYVLPKFGLDVDYNVENAAQNILFVIGLALSIYGRFKATKQIVVAKQPKS